MDRAPILRVKDENGQWHEIAAIVGPKGELVPATETTLGGVKVGNGLNVTEDGTISLKYAEVSNAQGGKTITIG